MERKETAQTVLCQTDMTTNLSNNLFKNLEHAVVVNNFEFPAL